LDRQLCGAINVYLKMRGVSSLPKHLLPCGDKVYEPSVEGADEGGRGVTPIGDKGDDIPSMNPRGGLSLMSPRLT